MIHEKGFRIPEDISVVGYDGIMLNRVMNPRVTTIHQNMPEIGRKAADLLIGLIEKPKTTLIEHVIVPGTFVQGGSVRNLV